MAKVSYEKIFAKKLKESDTKIKTSFVLIRQDIDEVKATVEAMRDYLKKKDKQYVYAKKEDNKIRDEFRKDVDGFTQQISQLKLALSAVREVKNEVIVRKDIAQIEDRIKISFKNEVEDYKTQVKDLQSKLKEAEKRIAMTEKGIVREKRKWFSKN